MCGSSNDSDSATVSGTSAVRPVPLLENRCQKSVSKSGCLSVVPSPQCVDTNLTLKN